MPRSGVTSLNEQDAYGYIRQLEQRIISLEQGLGPWYYLEVLNGWVNAGAPFSDLAVRRGVGPQCLEFKGHITDGASNTVCAIVPDDLLGDFTGDQTWLTDLATSPTTFIVARIYLDVTTGEITIIFPAS